MRRARFQRGYFYPLDARAALDPGTNRAYLEACVRRALSEPDSARSMQRKRAAAVADRRVTELLARTAEAPTKAQAPRLRHSPARLAVPP